MTEILAPSRIIDLDQLEELNPSPITYRFSGRELMLGELAHVEVYRLQARIMELQAEAQATIKNSSLDGEDLKKAEALNETLVNMIVEVFRPFNPEIEPSWFKGLGYRKLTYLLKSAMEVQRDFATPEALAEAQAVAQPPPAPSRNGSSGRNSTRH